jgi:transposase-like protein
MKLYYHDQLVVVVVQIEVLRDQHVSFESQITHKQQTYWMGFDDKILSPYVRDIIVW